MERRRKKANRKKRQKKNQNQKPRKQNRDIKKFASIFDV